MTWFRRLALFAALLLFFGSPLADACPGCKDNVNSAKTTGLPTDAKGLTGIERGYSLSVLFLLAVPFSLIGGIGVMITKECRRISARDSQVS
jgi:hypothetical protein